MFQDFKAFGPDLALKSADMQRVEKIVINVF